jgi:protein-arginine kinase activator protein McsA
MGHSERTPHHCRTCGGILRAVYENKNTEPCALVCEDCNAETLYTPKARSVINEAAKANKKIVYDAAEQVWHPLTLTCKKCGATLKERRRPNAATPLEVRCSKCKYVFFKKPSKAQKAAP